MGRTKDRRAWVKQLMADHPYSEELHRLAEGLKVFEGYTEEQLQKADKTFAAANVNQAISLRKMNTPFLDAHIGDLGVYPAGKQQGVMEVRRELTFINELIDESQRFFAMTFDGSLSVADNKKARVNFGGAVDRIAELCEKTADQIGRLDLTG